MFSLSNCSLDAAQRLMNINDTMEGRFHDIDQEKFSLSIRNHLFYVNCKFLFLAW